MIWDHVRRTLFLGSASPDAGCGIVDWCRRTREPELDDSFRDAMYHPGPLPLPLRWPQRKKLAYPYGRFFAVWFSVRIINAERKGYWAAPLPLLA